MDVNELNMRGDMDCKKPRLLHTSDSSTHNGHISTINLSYQIVLQDHNYGSPHPPPKNETPYTVQCKQEPPDSYTPSVGHQINSNSQRGSTKQASSKPVVSPQSRATKPNGLNNSAVKRQRTSSGTVNGVVVNNTPSSPGISRRPMQPLCETPKTHVVLTAPPLIPKAASGFQHGDLNSHLYASVGQDKVHVKEEPKPVPNGSSGLSGYLSGWYSGSGATKELISRQRSDMRNSINDDSDTESIDRSPRGGTESDHEGEETETANEGEDGEDEQDDISVLGGPRDLGSTHEESVTRCICKFGHDDGYMICCDRCSVWQHVDCMNLDRNNIPEEYMCELCQPRRVDRARARAIQHRKRQEFRLSTPPPPSSTSSISLDRGPGCRRERSKDRNRNDDFVDVEKTPKKYQRTYSTPPSGSKYGRAGAKDRPEKLKPGKRAAPTKWKRRGSERQDDPVPRKRKMFRSKSETIDVGGPSSASENSPPSSRNSASGELLLQWIDHYEEAVTNHYSPELRARVAAVRQNGLANEFPSPLSSASAYRLASKAGGYKTLVASNAIQCGSPVIECRGKYMLASQLRPYKSGDGAAFASGLRPTPHIIFHQLLVDNAGSGPNIDMCVDGRSYGNDARFVWQSCQPNAEVKHKIEKGSVHLYLVARSEILESEEITVAHDAKNPLPCPYEGCPHMKTKDSGGRTGLAQAQSATTPAPPPPPPPTPTALSPVEADRKRRRRRTNSNVNDATAAATVHQTIAAPPAAGSNEASGPSAPAPPAVPSTPPAQSPTPVKRQQRTPSKVLAAAAAATAAHDGLDDSQDANHVDDHEGGSNDAHDNKKKLSREERKMEAIMKAFERMEKAQQRRQETQAKTTHRKDSRDGKEDVDDLDHSPSLYDRTNDKRALDRTKTFRKGKRGGRTRRTSSSTGEARTRVRALSGEMNSGHSATEEEYDQGGSSSSPGQTNSGPPEESSLSFKCPKTKKVVFNNWSGEGEVNGNKEFGGDLAASSSTGLSVPSCYMRNPNPRSPTRPFRTVHMRYGANQASIETKPSVMNSSVLNGCRPSTLAALKSPAGSASPDPHGDGAHSNDENAWATPLPGCGGGAGSAKKRWLRQAISEETETELPTTIGSSAPGLTPNANEALDHVTPLKKRRLARASLSSETSFTPPSTPTPTSGPSLPGDGAPTDAAMSSIIMIDKEESSTVESLSAENSQGTPPECDDGVSVDEPAANRLSNDEAPSPPVPPNLELAKAMVDLSASLSNSSEHQWTFKQEASVGGVEASKPSFASMEEHLIATTTLAQLHQDSSFQSPSRPTWEFRAPDAQFMKSRGVEASLADPASTAAAATCVASVQSSPVDEKPKPIKRKLSILEYRQRKQTTPSEVGETPPPKDESRTAPSETAAGLDSCATSTNNNADPVSASPS